MPSKIKSSQVGRLSVYELNTDGIQLSVSDIQLREHTGYDEEHLRRLKCLFQQATGPTKKTLDIQHFESAARAMCHSLTESSDAHHLAEILFKAYDKNTNGSIDFHEMIHFVWTVIDAPREEQIAGLYQALQESHESISKDRLIELVTILKNDLQPRLDTSNKARGQTKPLKTDEDIRNRVEECFHFYPNSPKGLDLNQVTGYFLGADDPLTIAVQTRWNARMKRHDQKNKISFKS